MSLNALRQDVIINRLVVVVIAIFINHILEVVHHHIALLHIAINHPATLIKTVQAVQV